MRPLPLAAKAARSLDGTEIRYYVAGSDGPNLVLLGGLGADHRLWRAQIEYLRSEYRVITWDLRGMYDANGLDDPGPNSVVEQWAADMTAILKAENACGSVVATIGAGVHVLLAAIRLGAVAPSHVVLINGLVRRPSTNPLAATIGARLTSGAIGLVMRGHPLVAPLGRRVARWPETVTWLKRLGLVGPTVEQDTLAEVAASFSVLNVSTFLRGIREVMASDVSEQLRNMRMPMLIIAGERDLLAPKEAAEQLGRALGRAELFVIRGATHYAPIEHPEAINLRIEKFLRERAS